MRVPDARAERERAVLIARAVVNSRCIGAAIGIVMMLERLDEGGAFDRLCRVSQNINGPRVEVALHVVRSRTLPLA